MGPIVDNNNREIDPVYITETDNIFKATSKQYAAGTSPLFPPNDSPALIEITGSIEERINQISMYVTEEGNMYGEEQSLINTDELLKMEKLIREQKEYQQKEKGFF